MGELKPGPRDLLWMGAGAALLLLLVVVALHFQAAPGSGGKAEFKARGTELVEHMRFSLAAASDAEKSAVMAITDGESQKFADEARAATAEVERRRVAVGELLAGEGSRKERELLASFSTSFTEFQRVDRELLTLAVKNTNLKAFALAFGPAAQAVEQADTALSHFLTANAGAPGRTLLLAARAQAAMLRLEARLAPHIAEESDQKMDEMEALMSRDDQEVRGALDDLAQDPAFRSDPDLAAARTGYARFSELRTQILALSRENTNVRSLTISLDQKRKATAMCQDALAGLQQELAGEPEPAAPANPRRF